MNRRGAFGLLIALVLGLGWVWLRCVLDPATLPESPATASPEIWVSGCLELREGECIYEADASLLLWVDTHAAASIEVRIDDAPQPAQAEASAGRLHLRVHLPAGARKIEVVGLQPRWNRPFAMSLQQQSPPPWMDSADDRVDQGDFDGAVRILHDALESSSGWPKLRGLDTLRRIENARGRLNEAWTIGRRQRDLARQLDAPQFETFALAAEANGRIVSLHDLLGAREILPRLFELARTTPLASMRADYIAALLARRSGDTEAAVRHLSQSRRTGERLGEVVALVDVVELEALALGELGRADEALELSRSVFETVRGADLDCARRLQLAYNFGWTQLVLAASELPHDEPRPYFLQALELLEQCPDDWSRANVLINLALTDLQEGSPRDALGWLARTGQIPADLQPWADEIAARAGLDLSDPLVEASMLTEPALTWDPQLRWNSMVRRAESLRRWGFAEQAVEVYRRAEALLERRLGAVGIDTGSDLYLAGRTASARGLVGTLTDLGRPREALCAARLARARALGRLDRVARLSGATPEQKSRWEALVFEVSAQRREIEAQRASLWELSLAERDQQEQRLQEASAGVSRRLDEAVDVIGLSALPRDCDDLRSPGEGEVLLTVTPADGAWIAFAAAGHEIDATVIDEHALWTGHGWPSALPSLREAELVTLIPAGASWEIPLHAARFDDGTTLLELAPVRYSLDLPPRPSRAPGSRTVVVVADPSRNLPLARQEADEAIAALQARQWDVRALTGPAATREAVASALGDAALFHYAGHGVHAGIEGWDSALLLHDRQQLRVHDILALPAVPVGVVLTGCETGAVQPTTVGGAMNLSRAFVLAGASWVIASDDVVDDAVAKAVGVALYGDRGNPIDGATSLRKALLRTREQAPQAWTRFRVVTP